MARANFPSISGRLSPQIKRWETLNPKLAPSLSATTLVITLTLAVQLMGAVVARAVVLNMVFTKQPEVIGA